MRRGRLGTVYEKLIRPLLFQLEAERAHDLVGVLLKSVGSLGMLRSGMERVLVARDREQPAEVLGLTFPNEVGVAAGFDKNATLWPALFALGFGHVEVGTVTLREQPGNPRPRMFRFLEEEALVNRMGFNSEGVERVARRLEQQFDRFERRGPLGINIGKSRTTSVEDAAAEYGAAFERLAEFADYVVINLSSPNTPGLRALQARDRLGEILEGVLEAKARIRAAPPVLLKIDPDLPWEHLDDLIETVVDKGLDGVVATNTTVRREGLMATVGEGGVSGRPLRPIATDVISHVRRATNRRLTIIGGGGVSDVESAAEKLDAGAGLVQLYTGMIFRGPLVGREIARGLCDRATLRRGLASRKGDGV